MIKNYLFYDLETTGLSKTFDQILQFAAIRTDLQLNEIERFEFLIKLNPDVIPSPGATITHRTSLHSLDNALDEYTAMRKIHDITNTSSTISIGYNSLSFDDEFLRFGFYRNLLSPYTHQYANQCSRADIYPITAMYYLFSPNSLKWPTRKGNISLKLENLAKENNIDAGQAHTAIVDVIATIELAKKLKTKNPKMWDYLMGYYNKNTDAARIAQLPKVIEHCQLGIMIEPSMGARHNYCVPVLGLGSHYYYKNQTIWLRLDCEELRKTTIKDIAKNTWTLNKKLAEPGFLLPPTDHYQQHISSERKAIMETNLTWLKNNTDVLEAIAQHHCHYQYPLVPQADIDSTLYTDGFPSSTLQRQCADFHTTPNDKKANCIDQISDTKYRELAIRAIGKIDPDLLTAEQKISFNAYLQKIYQGENIVDFKNQPRLSPTLALEDINNIRNKDLDLEQIQLLDELQQYIQKRQQHPKS